MSLLGQTPFGDPAAGAPAGSPSWPNAATIRAAAHCWIVIAGAYCIYDFFFLHTQLGLTNGMGQPLGDDFINYWSAAKLASLQRAAEIYDLHAFNAFQTTAAGAPVGYLSPIGPIAFYHYSYPPALFLLTLPLAALPYAPALGVWLTAGWYGFYRGLRLAMPDGALLLALATPAVFINTLGGQNGVWTAALFGGGLCLLQRRPVAAGILFGLLIYKPHLALLIPVALLAGREWRAFAAAVATVVVVLAASLFAFGPEIWADYFRNATLLRQVYLEGETGIWHRMVSVFMAARRFGAGIELAYAIQAATALAAAVVVALAWARRAPANIRYSLLMLGAWLATPYLMDYDLVACAFVVAWLAVEARTSPHISRPAFIVSILILAAPIAAGTLGNLTGLSFGAFFLISAFVLVVATLPATVLQLPARFARKNPGAA